MSRVTNLLYEKENGRVATDLISLCLFCNVPLIVSICVLLTTVLPANSLWPVNMALLVHVKPGQGSGILPVKTETNVCSNLNAIQNLQGINTFSLCNFPNADYIPDVKEDVGAWFRSMRGVRHTYLDGYID